MVNQVRQQKRPLQDLTGLTVELRRLAADHADLSRELSALACRIENGDWNELSGVKKLGEIGERIVGAILRGESEDYR